MQKRVLLISNMYPSLRDPGYGTFVERCAKGLVRAGVETELVTMHQHHSLWAKLLGYLRFAFAANARIALRRYDCIYIHQPLHSLIVCLPMLSCKPARLALSFHGHDLLPVTRRGRLLHRLVCSAFLRAEKIVVPSEHFKRIYDAKFGATGRAQAAVFRSGGVAEAFFTGAAAPCTQHRGRTALFLSRWISDKGWADFLRIAGRLHTMHPDFSFTIAGGGPDRGQIESAVQASGLRDVVRIVEVDGDEQSRALYCAHRYFILPTRFDESLALVNLEAMASGCIVFSADFAAASEYIDCGVNGYRLPLAGFVDGCVRQVGQLETDLALAQSIASCAARSAMRFGEGRVLSQLPKILGLATGVA
jgi:glycosyltransferase involved in cell wall biosynthesis